MDDELILAYQIVKGAGSFAYQLYSNWDRDISPKKFKAKIQASNRIARVAVVGLGGAGKTTLIKTLTGCDKLDPRIANRGISPIILGREERRGWLRRTTRTVIIYCDTEGQRPQAFVTAMLEADENEILHKGCFDALIFVVDVKAPMQTMYRDEEIIDSVDWSRLGKHVEEWSDYALSLLFDTMSDRLKLCLVFVNKCNLVKELSGQEKQKLQMKILDSLSPLTQRLQVRTRGALLKVIQGSARDVEEVSEARQLIETRVLNGEAR
jgi:signal recognition particle receptor subunit beta